MVIFSAGLENASRKGKQLGVDEETIKDALDGLDTRDMKNLQERVEIKMSRSLAVYHKD